MKAQAKERRAYRRAQSVQESAAADESTPADEGTAAGESEAAGADESSDAGSTSSEETGGAEAADGSKASYNVTWDDMADVKMVLIAPGAIPPGLPEVEAAVNELTESQINTHVTIEMLEMGNYIQQVSLKMSSNEQVDLLMTFPGGSATFSAMQSQGQLMDITDLMSEYGQPVLDTVGDYIKATTIAGGIYGVLVYRNYASYVNALMRADVVESLGLTEQAQSIETLADFEEILAAVKASDEWSQLSLLAPAAGNGSIGYIYSDSATSTESAYDLIKGDKLFATLISGELDIESVAEGMTGMDMICVPIMTLPVKTQTCTMFSWVVPQSSAYPEAAVTLLSMMYTDPEINNLLAWGIEGRDYVVEDGVANYPNGDSNVPYHSSDYINGNHKRDVCGDKCGGGVFQADQYRTGRRECPG